MVVCGCVSSCVSVCQAVFVSFCLYVCAFVCVSVCLCVFPCRPIHWQNMCCRLRLTRSAEVVLIRVVLIHAGVVLSSIVLLSYSYVIVVDVMLPSSLYIFIKICAGVLLMCWRLTYTWSSKPCTCLSSLIHLCISKARRWRWQ